MGQIHDCQHAITFTFAQGQPDVDVSRIGGLELLDGNDFVVFRIGGWP